MKKIDFKKKYKFAFVSIDHDNIVFASKKPNYVYTSETRYEQVTHNLFRLRQLAWDHPVHCEKMMHGGIKNSFDIVDSLDIVYNKFKLMYNRDRRCYNNEKKNIFENEYALERFRDNMNKNMKLMRYIKKRLNEIKQNPEYIIYCLTK